MLDAVLSLVVLAAIALLIGAFVLWRKGGSLKQAGLMVLLAIVAIVNVLIWTLPDAGGVAPIERAEELSE
jgi:uncharacterized membrane protein